MSNRSSCEQNGCNPAKQMRPLDAIEVEHLPDPTLSKGERPDQFPNTWARWRHQLREPFAEFLGTMILIFFGAGANCHVVLSSSPNVTASPKGDYLQACWGWAMGITFGIYVSAGISGGHINPAVTLAQVIFRRFPLHKLPIYVLAQLAGAFVGALIVYGNYWRAIDLYDQATGGRQVPGTAGLFAAFPQDYLSAAGCFFSEFLGTAIFLICIFMATDSNKGSPPPRLAPFMIGLSMLAISACYGYQTSFAINPARDLGPRLMTWIFYGKEVWNFRSQYWLWTPVLGPFAGAIAGAAVYDALIYTGTDSPLNSVNFLGFNKRKAVSTSAADDVV